MNILRETRAKIDPQLLDAMKDHLTAAMPHVAAGAAGQKTDPDMPLSSSKAADRAAKPADPAPLPKAAAPAAAAAYRQGQGVAQPPKPAREAPSFSQELAGATRKAAESAEPVEAKAAYPKKTMDEISSEKATEPVDRQKIAQIVLQYMKNREENSRH